MFASTLKDQARRRGVVLVVILGMLGLLALIGVTFAAFSGQAQINARNYMNAQNFPDSSEMMDYALSQLINDTANPASTIRGHSLKRDMYGNDAGYNAAFLNGKPDGSDYIYFTNVSVPTTGTYAGYVQCVTNISLTDSSFYQYPNGAFSRWIVRFPPQYKQGYTYLSATPTNTYVMGQTHEILVDDATGSVNTSYRVFYLKPPDSFIAAASPTPPLPVTIAQITGYTSYESPAVASLLFPGLPPASTAITMDGRFLHAFNGTGISALGTDGGANPPHPLTEYANFRYNGNILLNALNNNATFTPNYLAAYGDPDYSGDSNHYAMPGMDEDYDAADLENWFLAIQSADGNIVVPSFHRPGILTSDDWTNTKYNTNSPLIVTRSMSKILRPRAAEGHNPISFPDLVPDSTGRITYDVDNDGDRVTDSVWLDLGYPSLMNTEGQLYKPLFAFTVIGLNGKLPLNTAGNLQNISQVGEPQFTHASHLGYSPSEIDITFALQNAYSPAAPTTYTQVDNAGVDVKLTQARNLLTGTRLPSSVYDPNAASPNLPSDNGDSNYVVVNNRRVLLPNNVGDGGDNVVNNSVPRTTTAIPGRWGEEGGVPSSLPLPVSPATIGPFNNSIRAGLSYVNGGAYDVRDDNYNTFDMFPSPANGENADYYDAAGTLSFPVERIRRFVYPLDVWGDGRITTYGSNSKELGSDLFGRISFFHYFRPPGVLIASNGYVSPHQPAPITGSAATPNITNNPLHGFESQRNPFATVGFNPNPNGLPNSLFLAAQPSDMPGGTMSSGGPTTLPTYSASVNSNPYFVSPGLNEADEMKIFEPTVYDAPFGPADIAWLYRYQDVDGGSLHSRLASLAPISFLNPADGTRRRRLFSLDTFDTTNFVWANDNPSGVFPNNSHFGKIANAGFYNLNTNTPQLAQRDRRINLNFPLPVSNSPIEPIRQKWIRDTYRTLKAVLPPKSVDTPEELLQLSQYVVNMVDFRDPDGTSTRFVNTDVEEIPPTTGPLGVPSTVRMRVHAPTLHGEFDPNWKESTRNATDGSFYPIQFGMEYNPIAINEVLAYQFNTKNNNTNTPVQRMFIEVVNTLVQDAGGSASSLDLTGWDWVVMPDDNLGRPDPFTGQIPAQPTIGAGSFGNIWPYYLNGKEAIDRTTGTTYAPSGAMTTLIPALTAANGANADNAINYYYVFGNALLNASTWVANPIGSAPRQPGDANNTLIETNNTAFTTSPFTAPGLLGDSAPAGTPGATNSIDNWTNGTYPTNYPAMKDNNYYWLYLRRPANPFDLSTFDYNNPNENRVVVDCFRFIYLKATTTGMTNPTPPPPDTVSTNPAPDYLFSLQRMQPYRGGHAIKPLNDPNLPGTLPTAYVVPAYGYSEQTTIAPSASGISGQVMYGMYGQVRSTGEIYHSLGASNNSGTTGANNRSDVYWDWVPFHDRDFMSPAELTLVPGCPPGLFTKQFVEQAPPIVGTTNFKAPVSGGWPASASTKAFWDTSTQWPAGTTSWPVFKDTGTALQTEPHTFPYLNDEFFYTGANEPTVTAPNLTIWPEPTPSTGPHPPHNATNNNLIGGPSGAGWAKMLEFFEVPSPAFGAIGPVASGSNYDWLRQDLRPGLINLNLIIDEEVFLGLMGPNFYKVMNQVQVADAQTPALVTQVESTVGAPTAKINMTSSNGVHGYLDNYTVDGGSMTLGNNLKSSFSDFLKLRHGGSGYLFAYGRGQTGQNGQPVTTGTVTTQTPVAPERPYHALSYPDIDYTVFRPAALPSSLYTTPSDAAANNGGTLPGFNASVIYGTPAPNASGVPYAQDPGVKSPYFYTANNPVQPPPIPPRRLFQIPDWYGSIRNYTINASTSDYPSNAATVYYGNSTITYSGDPRLNSQTRDPNLANPMADLSAVPNTDASSNIQNVVYLGIPSSGVGTPTDHRDHPYFRNEWLQRITNLTTVRTHQYAVWITVGFFEVTTQGDPLLATTNPAGAYDILGLEIGALDGKNVRYRSFFLIDRTRATGFNHSVPDDFRNLVVYRQSIE